MSNPIKTHRLIVTLPDTSGEEADTMASSLEGWATCETHGGPYVKGATVTHALGESLPDGAIVKRYGNLITMPHGRTAALTADDARELAGVLIAHAETIENNNPQEAS